MEDIEGGGKKVTAVNHQTGGTLRYTTDGTDPTSASSTFPTAGLSFTDAGTYTVKVGAFKSGMAAGIRSVTFSVE